MAEFVGFVRVVQLEAKRDGLLHDFCIDTSLEGLSCIFALLSQSFFKSLISMKLQASKMSRSELNQSCSRACSQTILFEHDRLV